MKFIEFDNDVKASVSQIDNSVLAHLVYAAQMALNDMRVSQMVAAETGLDQDLINTLAGLAIDLSTANGEQPEITTLEDLEKETLKLKQFEQLE